MLFLIYVYMINNGCEHQSTTPINIVILTGLRDFIWFWRKT